MNSNPFVSFITEIFTRLKSKSPKFFQIWQWIFGAIIAITGIPEFLKMINVSVSEPFSGPINRIVAICSAIVFIFAKLPVKSDPVTVTSDNKLLTKVPEDKLPFTEGQEKKKAIENGMTGSNSVYEVMKSNVKTIILLITLSCIASAGYAQSFFKPLPKERRLSTVIDQRRYEVLADSEAVAISLVVNAWRPIVSIAAYAEPGHLIMTGAGAGYQHLVYNAQSQKYECQYSISVLGWAAGNVSPGPQNPAFAFGPAVGFFNNLLLVGGAYDFTNKKVIAAISLGISLNN